MGCGSCRYRHGEVCSFGPPRGELLGGGTQDVGADPTPALCANLFEPDAGEIAGASEPAVAAEFALRHNISGGNPFGDPVGADRRPVTEIADIAGTRAFCPLSQLELRPVADPAAYVGQRLEFRVMRHEEDRRGTNVVLSRRALLEEAARGRADETRPKVVVGAVLPGVVTAIKDFGAFVDVGGIEGLLPASEISFDRATRPDEVLVVGQPVTVQVMRVERDDARRPEQVSFSLKALERDPWQDAAAQFPAGTAVRGQVTRAEPFGAFVQLAPGVEGLIHISELGANRQLRHARDAVKPGDALEVVVLALEPDKRRISLGLATGEQRVDDEGRAAAARASGGGKGGMGTLGDLLKGKLPGGR